MKKLFFLMAFCASNYVFSQNQLLTTDTKKTNANAGKNSLLTNASDSLSNPSTHCILNMSRTTDAGNGATGKEVIKNDNPVPKEQFLKKVEVSTSPPLKDER